MLETTTSWELENNNRKEQHKKRLEDWNNKTRIEKIEHIKKTTITEQQQVDIQNDKQHHQKNHETPNNVVWKLSQETTNIENQEIAKGIVIQLIEQTVSQSTKKQQTITETEDISKKITTNNMITNNSKSKIQQKINNYFCTDRQDTNTTKIKLAKTQKSKMATGSQSENLVFDGSPETTPRNMTSRDQPSLHPISTCSESLPHLSLLGFYPETRQVCKLSINLLTLAGLSANILVDKPANLSRSTVKS